MTSNALPSAVIRGGRIEPMDSPDDYDVELPSPAMFYGSHVNAIPLQGNVQVPRLFYGARFFNQAMPVVGAEAAYVQNVDPEDGVAFDRKFGTFAGALRWKGDAPAKVTKLGDDFIEVTGPKGPQRISTYKNFPFNRKSQITQTPVVKVGDTVEPGGMLARSNYTNEEGDLSLGLNARITLLPFKGHSMDDAVVISESFAKRLRSEHSDLHAVDYKKGLQGGKQNFLNIYPAVFKVEQLDLLDDDGVVKPGMVVRKGDPLILATKPKVVSSTAVQTGRLGRAMRDARSDASTVWDGNEGVVTDVKKTPRGVKVVVRSERPTEDGDKIVLRSGNKGTVSLILPDHQMPRTEDGEPIEVLLNQLGLPSRVNEALPYEAWLGKIAKKTGKPYKIPSFMPGGGSMLDWVTGELKKHGLQAKERVFDPQMNRFLLNPVSVGNAYVLKLHHVAASKTSGRGQGSYSADQQPLKGGDENAQSKRMSGLENGALQSSGGVANLREVSTLRGQMNEDFWKDVRAGRYPRAPGRPFVWDKFLALLSGAGMKTREVEPGVLRLAPMTDKDLDERGALELSNAELVDPYSLEPVKGGLFDEALVGGNRWGRLRLPERLPNPAYEDTLRTLLRLNKREFRSLVAGSEVQAGADKDDSQD